MKIFNQKIKYAMIIKQTISTPLLSRSAPACRTTSVSGYMAATGTHPVWVAQKFSVILDNTRCLQCTDLMWSLCNYFHRSLLSTTTVNGNKMKKKGEMSHFLLGLGCGPKRLFCSSKCDTHAFIFHTSTLFKFGGWHWQGKRLQRSLNKKIASIR